MVQQTTTAIGTPPRMRSVVENGQPILTVARVRHGSGRREMGGGPVVPIVVALSENYEVERRTRKSTLRRSPTIGAVTVADPAERTIFTVEGAADVLQLFVSLSLIQEAADIPLQSVRALFNEHDLSIERSAMSALTTLTRHDSHSDLLLTSIAYQLAGILLQDDARQSELRHGGITSLALHRIRDLVQARLDEPVPASPPLSQLAQQAGVSKHHFIKAFRQTVGETPYAWVLRYRIERARALLTHPDQTVGHVAFRTGFSSPAHFIAVFRKHLGVTPGVFREAVLK